MIIMNDLKYDGQKPSSKQALAMLIILPRYTSLLIMYLRWPYKSLSGSGTDELLYLAIAFINSSLKKRGHSSGALSGISSRISILICWSCVMLNIEWRACQRSLISRHRWSLYLMASTTGRFLFLTLFMSSQSPLALFTISWIFWLKNEHLVFLTVFLNCFQLAKLLNDLYFSKFLLQLMSHQLFECFKILIILEFLSQALSTMQASKSIIFSNDLMLDRLEVLMNKMFLIKSLINDISSSLFLAIECFGLLESCPSIRMVIVRGCGPMITSTLDRWYSCLTQPNYI